MKSTVLFHCPDMANVAQRIVRSCRGAVEMGVIEWKEFRDGFPNLFIQDVEQIEEKDVVFLASFSTPGEIFRQLALLCALPAYGARSLQVFLPYFPPGTMERVDSPGQIATAKTLARQLSMIPSCLERKTEIIIFDIHALQEWHYFGDGVRVRLVSALPLLEQHLHDADVSIAFPDDGARKRVAHLVAKWPHIICDKHRLGDERKVVIKEGNVAGRHVIIVDDLVQTGGTLLACKDVLVQTGAVSVSIFATHGVFPNELWKAFIDCGFETVWITDSCPWTASAVSKQVLFQIVSLVDTISTILLRKG